MPLALKKVRQQLGENAIIVNTRAIKTGGIFGFFAKQKYEVTAYSIDNATTKPKPNVDRKGTTGIHVNEKETVTKNTESMVISPSVFHKNPQKLYNFYSNQNEGAGQQEGSEQKKTVIQKIDPPHKQEVPKKQMETETQLLDELQHMRKMMVNFMLSDNNSTNMPPQLVKWINQLKKQGVNEEVIGHITNSLLHFQKYESLNELTDAMLKSELKTILEVIIEKRIPKTKSVDGQTRIINVIGPTGVGKTTTIAKLATEQVLKQKRRVAMITTDVYRIAAVEQLKIYAGILNVPIEVVRSTEELEKAVTKLNSYDLIYMDTTGRNYIEMKNRESIFEYLKYPLQSENYLVLSLTTKFEDMQILLNSFLDSPVNKLILTKFDETTSYGSILNIAFKYPYELAYITNGQSVPEDIAPIDAELIVRYLLGEEN